MPIELHGAGGGGGSSAIGYAVCSTAASTTQKTVTVPDFELKTGYHLSIIFNNVVGDNATLNVNGTGARYIQWHGVNLKSNAIPAGNSCKLVYTGNYWYLLSSDSLAASGGGNVPPPYS